MAYKKSSESSYTNAGVTFNSGTQFIFGGGNLSVDYSYDIRFTLTDAFGTVTVVDSLSTASVLMDFKAGGTGLAVGKVSETDSCFEVSENWDVKVALLSAPVRVKRMLMRKLQQSPAALS